MEFAEPIFNFVSERIRKWRLYRQYTLLLLYVLKITFSLEKMFGYFVKAVCISIMYVQKELTSM